MSKTSYNYDYLKMICDEKGIELLEDYSSVKVLRDTRIKAKCLTDGCDEIVDKGFKQMCLTGCYCKICTKVKRNETFKKTCLEKYGFENPSQSKEIKDKKINTCLINYGVEHPMLVLEVKEKIKATCLENFGVEYASQSQKVKNKVKETCLKNYGVEHPSQSQEIKEKSKKTCLKNYGIEFPSKSKEIKNKIKETNLEKYGFICPLQNSEVKKKSLLTLITNHGVTHNSQSHQHKEKYKLTSLEKYGTEHPMQNTEFAEKASKNAYKSKDYTFPSGRIERIQGYEHFMLDELLQKENICEDDIFVSRSEVPEVWYEDDTGKKRRYFVDCYIKSQNRCIEVKSTWTAEKKKDLIFLKQKALIDAGYNCEIWIYDSNGNKVESF